MSSEKAQWLLWRDHDRAPAENMAIDEALLECIAELGQPIIRTYDWDCPAVSIGYSQDYEAAPQEGYSIVRRPTGGGVVFHTNDLTYTAVIPPDDAICSLNRTDSYRIFHEALLLAFEIMGVPAELHNEEIEDVDRRVMKCFVSPTKFDIISKAGKHAGAAQRRGRAGLLHQGSILMDGLPCSKPGLTTALIRALQKKFNIEFKSFEPDEALLQRASELAKNKYSQDAWNKDRNNG
jgi:lipoyl(octanoyl) transferase